uniref:Cuticular protein n=1 Tax=Nilaparvata lugens TaxID=108931 RepID=A0A2S1ZS28_NILLU|nr:cuticular protein [Nilaparvata lugens]
MLSLSVLQICILFLVSGALGIFGEHHRQKRQLFREQVLPHTGGKIPEDAFRSDRLALNRLNKEGIAVPDGVLLEARHHEAHHSSHRNDPDITQSIIRLVQKPDGRYAPPEGNYPFDHLIESTYIIRPPISAKHSLRLPPFKPIEIPLRIPSEPFFPSEEDVFHLTNHIDSFYNYNHLDDERAWPGLTPLYHGAAGRILREVGTNPNNYAAASMLHHKVKEPPPRLHPFQPQKSVTRNLNSLQKRPEVPKNETAPNFSGMPKTNFKCTASSPRMIADPEGGCQVFHLCHMDGHKESFMCPKGMRYHAGKSQCLHWQQVPCNAR